MTAKNSSQVKEALEKSIKYLTEITNTLSEECSTNTSTAAAVAEFQNCFPGLHGIIPDALDNLNNKQAIKLADNILKKQKTFACAKALKALALIRSGKVEESVTLLDDIKSTAVKIDDGTLQAMTICYKETRNPKGILEIYELAVKQTPKNEEFLSHLFMACVRVEDHVKQQQAAMNLYKAFPKNPYYFWAVMSIVMQAKTSSDASKKTMFLCLAERMVIKLIKENKLEAEEEVRLYMMILEQQEKYEELLKLLNGESKLPVIMFDKSDKIIEYLTALQKWRDINIFYKKLLQDNPDQWSYHKGYLNSFLKLLKEEYSSDVPIDTENEQPDHKIEHVQSFLSDLASQHPAARGPRLAVLELTRELQRENKSTSEEIFPELVQYFATFGGKPCCFLDMQNYMLLLHEEKGEEFIQHISSENKKLNSDGTQKDKINGLMRNICIECLSRQLGLSKKLSNNEKLEKSKMYWRQYKESLELGANLRETEWQHGDSLVLLAVYLLNDINKNQVDGSMNWHILLFLEQAVEFSRSNFQFKLLLYYLYSKTGAFGACEQLMDDIEIKYIMYDTLGYFLTYGGYISGQFQAVSRLYDTTLAFFAANEKDTPEQIIASYKYGSFQQVIEITNFKRKISQSYQYFHIMVEKLHLDLLKYGNSKIEVKKQLVDICETLEPITVERLSGEQIYDNRDLNIVDHFEALSQQSKDEHKEKSFAQNLLWLRYRYLVLKCLTFCVQNGGRDCRVVNGHITEKDSLDSHLAQIQDVLADSRNYDQNTEWTNPYEAPPCHMVAYVNAKFHDVITLVIRSFVLVATINDNEVCTEDVRNNLKQAGDVITENVASIQSTLTITQGDKQVFDGKSLSGIVYLVETCSLSLLFVLFIKETCEKSLMISKKEKKKKNLNEVYEEITNGLKMYSTLVSDELKKLLNELKTVKRDVIDKTLDVSVLEHLFEQTNCAIVTKVWEGTQASFQQSVNEIIQTIEVKLKFIDTIFK